MVVSVEELLAVLISPQIWKIVFAKIGRVAGLLASIADSRMSHALHVSSDRSHFIESERAAPGLPFSAVYNAFAAPSLLIASLFAWTEDVVQCWPIADHGVTANVTVRGTWCFGFPRIAGLAVCDRVGAQNFCSYLRFSTSVGPKI